MHYIEFARANLEASRRKTHRESSDRVSTQWGDLSFDIIKAKSPDLCSAIERAEDKLNQVWVDCRTGNASQTEFGRVLQEWETAHLSAVQECSSIADDDTTKKVGKGTVEWSSKLFGD